MSRDPIRAASSFDSAGAAPAVIGDLTADQRAAIDVLASGLPTPVQVQTILVRPPSAVQLESAPPDLRDDGLFITVESDASEKVDVLRAEWQAELLISAVWRKFDTESIGRILGGSLSDSSAEDIEQQSTETWFSESQDAARFTAADGTPSKLVASESELRAAILGQANDTGAALQNLSFGRLLGTDIEVDLKIDDPEAWINALGSASPFGGADPRDLEGVMLVAVDKSGDLIKSSTFSTGCSAGAATYGAKYSRPPFKQLAGEPTTPAPS